MKKKISIIILLLGCILVTGVCEKGKSMDIGNLIPSEINGWKTSGKDGLYDRQTLFDYIDGGAEVYLTYSFQEAFVRKFEKEEHPFITVEIFDMGKPDDAFGIFTFERENEDIGIGQGSEYADGLLRFWKGHFFVSIFAEAESESSKRAIYELGQHIDQAFSYSADLGFYEKGDFLPAKGLLLNQVRFFHKSFNLNYHYFVSDKNILNLDDDTDALLAPYLIDKEKCYLLTIKYSDPETAKQGYELFMNIFMPEAKNKEPIQMENNKWVASAIKNEFVLIIFDALSHEFAQQIMEQTLNNLKKKT